MLRLWAGVCKPALRRHIPVVVRNLFGFIYLCLGKAKFSFCTQAAPEESPPAQPLLLDWLLPLSVEQHFLFHKSHFAF